MKHRSPKIISFILSCVVFVSFINAHQAAAEPLVLGEASRSSLGVFEQGTYRVLSELSLTSDQLCGSPGDIPVPGNYLSATPGNIAVWNPSFGVWHVCAEDITLSRSWGMPGDVPVPADYNGDQLTDYAVYRPGTAEWYVILNTGGIAGGDVTVTVHGKPGDIPIPADYDGDGVSDMAVLRSVLESGGLDWVLRYSGGQGRKKIPFGLIGDVPVPADYNGDGSAQIALWRPSGGVWFIMGADGETVATKQLGLPGDIPSPSDIDGDGKADLVVYRPGSGRWIISSSSGSQASGEIALGQLGARVANDSRAAVVDRRAALDLDGDRVSDLALVRIGENDTLQFFLSSGTERTHPTPLVEFGKKGDTVAPGDYDGDGVSDLAVIRQEGGMLQWHFLLSASQNSGRTELIVDYGLGGDTVMPADFDGDDKTDLAVVRDMPDGSKLWIPNHSGLTPLEPVSWGRRDDLTLTADIDGDKKSDFIVVRPFSGELLWLIRTAKGEELEPRLYGFDGDEVILGDYNGDGKAEIGVIRKVNNYKMVIVDGLVPYYWGLEADLSLAAHYTGRRELSSAVWRVIEGQGFFFIRGAGVSAFGVPFGVVGDTPLSALSATSTGEPEGGTTPTGGGSSSGQRLNCASRTSVADQESGFVWKPISEGDGKLVVLFGASRAGEVLRAALVESGAEQDVVLETLRYVGNTNGGRPTFRARQPGRSYPSGVILVRQERDESVHCIDVPNPGQRYD